MIKVGIYGASGYMGSEALRVLLKHPGVSVEWATSRSDIPVEHYHKNFYGRGIEYIKPSETTACDVVFFCGSNRSYRGNLYEIFKQRQ